MFFIRESCPCDASPRGLGAAEGGEHQLRRIQRILKNQEMSFPGQLRTAYGLSLVKP
jgi:hypothetical protein